MDRSHDQFGVAVGFPGELVNSPAILGSQALFGHVLAQRGPGIFAMPSKL